ncbi:MAG: hypothetical protein C0607_03480 [Azoarcus sp.]|nr:MAG: hypothetical protein C0607_03480 [Azoarcus sp.]TVT55706.1 MAG: hypothetical protein FHK80_13905 [Azoarcus sp. PHD]
MSKIRRSDREKLEACLSAMLMVITGDTPDIKAVSASLRRQIGPGWTVVTALQWLTGKAAWQAIEAMKSAALVGGCTKAVAMEIVRFAADACKDLDASGGVDLAFERLRNAAADRLH